MKKLKILGLGLLLALALFSGLLVSATATTTCSVNTNNGTMGCLLFRDTNNDAVANTSFTRTINMRGNIEMRRISDNSHVRGMDSGIRNTANLSQRLHSFTSGHRVNASHTVIGNVTTTRHTTMTRP